MTTTDNYGFNIIYRVIRRKKDYITKYHSKMIISEDLASHFNGDPKEISLVTLSMPIGDYDKILVGRNTYWTVQGLTGKHASKHFVLNSDFHWIFASNQKEIKIPDLDEKKRITITVMNRDFIRHAEFINVHFSGESSHLMPNICVELGNNVPNLHFPYCMIDIENPKAGVVITVGKMGGISSKPNKKKNVLRIEFNGMLKHPNHILDCKTLTLRPYRNYETCIGFLLKSCDGNCKFSHQANHHVTVLPNGGRYGLTNGKVTWMPMHPENGAGKRCVYETEYDGWRLDYAFLYQAHWRVIVPPRKE